jgi:hypothetical protein
LFEGGTILKDLYVNKASAIPLAEIPASIEREHYTRLGSEWYSKAGVSNYQYMLSGVPYSVKGEPLEARQGIMSGGRGAYTSGYIELEEGDVLYVNIGGARVAKGAGGGFIRRRGWDIRRGT